MESQILLKQNLRSSAIIILVGLCFGLIYPFFGDELTDKIAFLNGISIGVIGGIMLSFFEYFVFSIDSRKWSFIGLLVLKTVLYFALFAILILTVICLTRSIENEMGFREYFYSDAFQQFIFQGDFRIILIYCLIVLIIINFTRQINRKIGDGILLNFIIGKYHKPREEERIFAFIDLKQSTAIAERLGALNFHRLLYEFFHDISISILVTKGEVYRYVGDEIVVSWKMVDGLKDANCIRSYFAMKKQLQKHKDKYIRLFRFIPDFHAAFHSGKVVRGEIGDVKSQFVFHGETMFIASKIENECSRLGYDILLTSDLLRQLNLPEVYDVLPVVTNQDIKNIELYTLVEKVDISG